MVVWVEHIRVKDRLADTPTVSDVILSAAAAARGLPGARPHAMTHSWVFSGPPGSGRSLAALAFAQTLVCELIDDPGCGTCPSCRSVMTGGHTDVEHVVPEGNTLSVDRVRNQIIPSAHSLPTVAQWRVIIIEDADRLRGEAANALLKTIEEPPASTVIILCTPSIAPEDFIPTLRSRCRHLYIPAPSTQKVVELINDGQSSPADLYLAARASMQHVGRARRLLQEETAGTRRRQAIALAEAIFEGDEAYRAVTTLINTVKKEVTTAADELDAAEKEKLEAALGKGGKGKGAAKAMRGSAGALSSLEAEQKRRRTRMTTDFLDIALVDLAGIYRDAIMLSTGAPSDLINPDYEGLTREIAAKASLSALVEAQEAIRQARGRLQGFVSPQVAIDGMVGRIRLAFR